MSTLRPLEHKLIAAMATAALALGGTVWTATQSQAAPAADPTAGLTRYPDSYKVQHPYNLPESARFSVTGGEYNLWILKGDKPFSKGSSTGARTEMRWATNWSSGEHLWQADVEIDPGTTGTCIMQVHAVTPGEAIYIQTKNGNLYNSVNTLLAKNIVGSWFHLAAAYDPSNHLVQVWVNNALVLSTHYTKPAGTQFYFKNGVYNLNGAKSETHFKNIQLWRQ
jgi:alginate lyase